MLFNKKVFGCTGITVTSSMWNADFSGEVPIMNNGTMRANDTALKYAQKRYMENKNYIIFGLKSFIDDIKMLPRTIDQRYENLFGKIDKKVESKEVYRNLLSCVDIENFGITFAVGGQNIGLTGVAQVFDGFNLDEETESFEITIQSPFATENKSNTTLGNKIKLDNAFFVHGFKVNPYITKDLVKRGIIDGYTSPAYDIFKESMLHCATALDSAIKQGCENTFNVFVTCKENSHPNINNLTKYLEYKRLFDVNGIEGEVDLTKLFDYLKYFEKDIETIEVYYEQFLLALRYDGEEVNLRTETINGLDIEIKSLLD
jgi:CRISPR-associated protein Csh2